jgi:GNAT superfamily N-acetyltransferase
MSAYRFCRTDDITLLVDALNRCWAPCFPGEAPVTAASFKRSIRDLQVWCSSCMVAFDGADPIGVLIGAKRASGTLVQKIAVHPEHQRQGHGRHLLTSLSSKLAILGPPRIVAEVPEHSIPVCELLRANGYAQEAILTDYVLRPNGLEGPAVPGTYVIPMTVDDLAANGLLEDAPRTCWERSIETLTARKDNTLGLAAVSDAGIDACILYIKDGDLLYLRTFVEDGGARLRHLLSQVYAHDVAIKLAKVHPAEMPSGLLESLGFVAAGEHRLYAATAH